MVGSGNLDEASGAGLARLGVAACRLDRVAVRKSDRERRQAVRMVRTRRSDAIARRGTFLTRSLLQLAFAQAHFTQTAFMPKADCKAGERYANSVLQACGSISKKDFPCDYNCSKATTLYEDYLAMCSKADSTLRNEKGFLPVFDAAKSKCARLESWHINGAPLTRLACEAPDDASDGKAAHLAEVRKECAALVSGGGVCPDACREPFSVLANYYNECGVPPASEHSAAARAGCTPMHPSIERPCGCEREQFGWTISCYDEGAMKAAAAALLTDGCDEMRGAIPRCAVHADACRTNFQIVQAHHDYCRQADVPLEVADAFHRFVGVCTECHVRRDRLCGAAGCLPQCPPVDCANLAAPQAAFDALERAFHIDKCADGCGGHYALLQAYHDGCEGIETVSAAVRDGFHRFADRCAASAGCNTQQDSYADPNVAAGKCAAFSGSSASHHERNALALAMLLPALTLVVVCAIVYARLRSQTEAVSCRRCCRLCCRCCWLCPASSAVSSVGQQGAHKAALLAAAARCAPPATCATLRAPPSATSQHGVERSLEQGAPVLGSNHPVGLAQPSPSMPDY